jgi:hypothetical protein
MSNHTDHNTVYEIRRWRLGMFLVSATLLLVYIIVQIVR